MRTASLCARWRELTSALQAAQVHGYIAALTPAFEAQCRRILGTLVKLALPVR